MISSSIPSVESKPLLPLAPISTRNNNSVRPTGHLEMDARVANERLVPAPAPRHGEVSAITMAGQHVANASPARRHHLTHLQKAVRAQSHPYTRANLPSSLPSSRSSAAPRKAKTEVTKARTSSGGFKKPPLACIFCRNREIVCGAPVERSTDNGC